MYKTRLLAILLLSLLLSGPVDSFATSQVANQRPPDDLSGGWVGSFFDTDGVGGTMTWVIEVQRDGRISGALFIIEGPNKAVGTVQGEVNGSSIRVDMVAEAQTFSCLVIYNGNADLDGLVLRGEFGGQNCGGQRTFGTFRLAKLDNRGFDTNFNRESAEWVPFSGNWNTRNGRYSINLERELPAVFGGPAVSALHAGVYENFTYTASLYRDGGSTIIDREGILIRGVLNADGWKSFVKFTYDYEGFWALVRFRNGQFEWLASGEDSPAFAKSKWAKLKVVSKGKRLRLFVNGVLVWKGKENKLGAGHVGFYANNGEGSGVLHVTKARLVPR